MAGRRALPALVFALTVVLLWQQGFVSPSPVRADDPTSGTLIPCGNGLVCGDDGIGPSDNIVVTGPEDHIVQTDASGPWGYIENEAKAIVSAVHGVPDDSQLTDWGRDELRAYIFNKLIAIAAKPAAQRTTQEQAALTKFQTLVKAKQRESAQNALDMYNHWDNNPCSFYWPADVATDPNAYVNQVDVQAWCTDPEGAGLTGRPASPSASDFTGMGTAEAFNTLATDPDGGKIQADITASVAFFGAFAAAAVGVAAGAAMLLASTAVVTAVGGALLSAFTSAVAGGGAAVASAAAAGWSITSAGAASTIAASVAGPVAIVVFGIIIIAIGIWQQVIQADVPKDLHASLDKFSLPDCTPGVVVGCYTPDIDAMAHDSTGNGYYQLQSVFLIQTLPDYSSYRTNSPAAHGADDPQFDVVKHTTVNVLGNPVTTDTPLGVVDSITPADWNSLIPLPQTAYIAGGWWVNDTASDPPTYHLTIPFVAPDGAHWQAGTTKVKVDASAGIPAHLEPGLILEKESDPQSSYVLKPGDSFYFKGAAAGVTYTATLIAPQQNWAPLISPEVSGDLVEGGTVTFHANATDANGDSLTTRWWVEPNSTGPALLIIGMDGQSQIDHCYTSPVTGDLLFNCPWDLLSGSDPTYTFHDSGDLHVHVITDDGHGGTASQVFQVHIGNIAPPVTMDDPTTSFSINEGGMVDLAGSFNDPGDDQVKIDVNWGDGSIDTQYFPCDYGPLEYAFAHCGTIHIPVPPAGHPQAFDFKHTFVDDPPGSTADYPITLTATDDDGGVTTKTFTATVANVDPTLTMGCGLTGPPGLGGNIFQCQTRYGEAPFTVPLNGFFDDPGSDTWAVSIDWGDGHTDNYTYPCPSGDPCPFQTESDVFLYLAQTGRTFINASHQYTDSGTFPIKVTVDDGDGGSVSDSSASAAISAPTTPSDTTDPTASIVTPADGSTYTLGQSVAADYSCADDTAIQSCVGDVADGANIDTSTVGAHTFTVTATDTSSNTGGATAHYTVVYPFSLASPYVAEPGSNSATAGSTLRVRFSLGGDYGLGVVRGLSLHRAVDCDTGAPLGLWIHHNISRLGYSNRQGMYYFTWKVAARFAGTCQEVQIRLSDGTNQLLMFHVN